MRTVHGGGAVGQALCESIDGEDLLHRLGRGRPQGRRDLRRAAQGLGARARRQGPADRLRRRRPRQRGLGLRLGRLRERRPDLLGDRAHLRRRDGRRRASSTASRRETERLTVGDPLELGRPRSGRWSPPSRPTSSPSSSTTRSPPAPSGSPAARARSPGYRGPLHRPDRARRGRADEMRIMQRGDLRPGGADRSSVDDEEEALERANDSNFGLGASVWTRDRAKGERMARRIESGMVWINDHSYSHGAMPVLVGRGQGLGPRPLALEVRLLRVRRTSSTSPGSRASPATSGGSPTTTTLGDAIRSSARPALRPQRRAAGGAARGRRPAAKVGARTLRKGR